MFVFFEDIERDRVNYNAYLAEVKDKGCLLQKANHNLTEECWELLYYPERSPNGIGVFMLSVGLLFAIGLVVSIIRDPY